MLRLVASNRAVTKSLFAAAPRAFGSSSICMAETEVSHKLPSTYTPPVADRMFAVVKIGGAQYKVTQNDLVVAEKLKNAEYGEMLELDDVLLVGSQNKTVVGRPRVSGAKVFAHVEEHTKEKKVLVFKKKRRKNYRRTQGHRREVTLLRINRIEMADGDWPLCVDNVVAGETEDWAEYEDAVDEDGVEGDEEDEEEETFVETKQ